MSRALITALVGGLPHPAVFVGLDARILAANGLAEPILGQGLAGRHYVTALRQPAVLEAIETSLSAQTNAQARYLGLDGGEQTAFDVRCAYVDAAENAGVLVSFTDVTSQEQVAHMRRDFVANVSHELRTPLTAVMGFIETLQGPAKDDPTAQARFLDIMAQETARMNRLVGDLLSLNRVESGARQRPTERVALADLLASIVHTLSPMADERDATLTLDVAPEADTTTVPADADQLRQVFTNLIENALKYGGPKVSVHVEMKAPAPEPRLRGLGCQITVRDTGPGFDPIHIPRLTERFYRIDDHRNREMGGTGLGLAIVKHIINRHRGRLDIHSKPEQGSEFTVILPVEPR